MIFAEKEYTYTKWCTQAEAQQQLRISFVKGLKPCNNKQLKDGWDHEETSDEDIE